jgi:hypothetical protein
MVDFSIRLLNAAGEIGISAHTDRAARSRQLPEGYTLTFRSWGDAVRYVEAAEAEHFTFSGKGRFGGSVAQRERAIPT